MAKRNCNYDQLGLPLTLSISTMNWSLLFNKELSYSIDDGINVYNFKN